MTIARLQKCKAFSFLSPFFLLAFKKKSRKNIYLTLSSTVPFSPLMSASLMVSFKPERSILMISMWTGSKTSVPTSGIPATKVDKAFWEDFKTQPESLSWHFSIGGTGKGEKVTLRHEYNEPRSLLKVVKASCEC